MFRLAYLLIGVLAYGKESNKQGTQRTMTIKELQMKIKILRTYHLNLTNGVLLKSRGLLISTGVTLYFTLQAETWFSTGGLLGVLISHTLMCTHYRVSIVSVQ